jgi:hypothetical protein
LNTWVRKYSVLPSQALITRIFTDGDGNETYSAGDTLLAQDSVNGLAGTTVSVNVGQTLGIEGAGQACFTVQSWAMDFENDGLADVQGTGSILGLRSFGTAGTYTARLDITYTTGTTVGTSVTINVQEPGSGGRVWIVENQIRSGVSIAGDCVPFKIDAVPSSLFGDVPTLEAWNGSSWTDLTSFVTPVAPSVNAGMLSLDVEAALAAGALTAGNSTPFRTRVGSVVSANDPGASQAGLQGLILLTPTTGSADVVSRCVDRPEHTVAMNPNRANLAELGRDGRVELPLGTVPAACVLRLLEPDPAGVPAAPGGLTIIVVRDISLLAGGTELTLGGAVRVRLYYKDENQDGIIDDNVGVVESSLRIIHNTGGGWTELGGTVRNDAENWVEAETTSFSEFAIAGDAGGGSGGGGGGGCSARDAGRGARSNPALLLGLLAVLVGLAVRVRRA